MRLPETVHQTGGLNLQDSCKQQNPKKPELDHCQHQCTRIHKSLTDPVQIILNKKQVAYQVVSKYICGSTSDTIK